MNTASRLTEKQIALIEALPNEGGAYYLQGGEKIAYPQDAIDEMAKIPVQRKTAPAEKKAIILHGAPGCGKTHAGMKRLKALIDENPGLVRNTAVISYDEFGAMFDIQEYVVALGKTVPDMHDQETPVNGATLSARQQLWLDFQPLGQYVRSQTLKHALKEELNLYIDTTSSGYGTIKLIELLRDLDYTHIEFWSYHNHLNLATERIENRLRPTSNDDLYKKRVGAYEMLPNIISAADRVSLSVNDSNYNEPEEFAVFRAGQFVSGHGNIAASLVARLDGDQRVFESDCAQIYGAAEARKLSDRLRAACDLFQDIVEPASMSSWGHYHRRMDRDFT